MFHKPPTDRVEDRPMKPTAREWLAEIAPPHARHTVTAIDADSQAFGFGQMGRNLYCSCGVYWFFDDDCQQLEADALRNVPRMKDGQIVVGLS